MIDLTPLLQAAIALAAAAITAFIIPWIKSKTDAEKWSKYTSVLDVLVKAAEQMYGVGEGPKKLAMVQQWLEQRGYTVDPEAIQAAVLKLHADKLDYSDAHKASVAIIKTETAVNP
jgi:hypothetical protein